MTFKQWFYRKTGRSYNPNFGLSSLSSKDLEEAWEKGKREGLETATNIFLNNDYDRSYQIIEEMRNKND